MPTRDIFEMRKPVIGMLHVPALPGSPRNRLTLSAITDWVLTDAGALTEGGIDILMLENFGDVPFYPGPVPVHTIAFMTTLALIVRQRFDVPFGINILRNDARAAMAVAAAVEADLIRVNVHAGARVTDQGLIEGQAHETIRYRNELNCSVKIFADVDVKHSAPLAPRSLAENVEETVLRACADAVIVTGDATGRPGAQQDLRIAKQAAGRAPVFAGSGVDASNVADVLRIADGLIVGTGLKKNGVTSNPVDAERVRQFMDLVLPHRT